MQENRQFIRHPSDIPLEISEDPAAGPSPAHLHNVSLGGLSFDSDSCPRQGAIVEIRIPFVRPPFESRGRVAWCRRRDGRYEIGVQFLDAEDAFRARMVEQILHIEQYKREVREREGRVLTGNEAAREWIGKYAGTFPGAGNGKPD